MKRDSRYAVCLVIAALLLIFFALGNSSFLKNALKDVDAGKAASSLHETPEGAQFPGFPIDLNTATVDDLMALPGVGEKTAAMIIDERERLGGFSSVADLLRVKRFGEERLKRLDGLVTVKRPADGE